MRRWVLERLKSVASSSVAAWIGLALLAVPDSAVAQSVQHYPAANEYATLSCEDGFPHLGDQDFNDVVLRYRIAVHRDANEKVTGFFLQYKAEAKGGTLWLGFAVRVPILASTPHLAKVRKEGGPFVGVTPKAGETDLVFILYENLREAFSNADGSDIPAEELINTDPSLPLRHGETIELEVTFSPSVEVDLNFPFDGFFFSSNDYANQIHLPQFGPTSLVLDNPASTALFGSADDCSDQICTANDGSVVDNVGRYYVDAQGLPWVLEYPGKSAWAREGVPIDQAYPQLSDWVASGGASHADWWRYGNPQYLFDAAAPPAVPGLLPGGVWFLLGTLAGLGALHLRDRL